MNDSINECDYEVALAEWVGREHGVVRSYSGRDGYLKETTTMLPPSVMINRGAGAV